MQLSKEDMFCEVQQPDKSTTSGSTVTTASTNVLDFGNHGDDVLNKLFWSLFVDADSNGVTVKAQWYTSDYEGFVDGSNNASETKLFETDTIAAASLTAGAYIVKNAPLPKGLKRYNRLKFVCSTGTTSPKVTAFVHDGRDEGTPFKGL